MVERIKHLPTWGAYALLAYMPFHIFLAQSLSLLTGGLDTWKVAKDFVAIILLVITMMLVMLNQKLRTNKTLRTVLMLTVAYGVIHLVIYAANKQTTLSVALLASAYNNRLFWYFLIAIGGMLLAGGKRLPLQLTKLVLIVSTLVCLLGLLQWFLPKDVLTHFGYDIARGVKPNFFINEDPNFPRVMSTIRDPNSLGAFLIVPLLILIQLFLTRQNKKKTLVGGLLLLHGLVLLLTFSRAAWGGTIIALGTLFFILHKEKFLKITRRFWPIIVGVILLVCLAGYSVRDTQFVRSVVFRIDDNNPANELDSDQHHLNFIKKGVEGVAQKPFGHGPGTAGIVSIQNKNGSFLTENYYVQLAHEVGVIGLFIFLAAWAYVVKLLVRDRSIIAVTLVTSAGAYAVMAMAMHIWSNEAVAAQWWLLSGATLAAIIHPRTRTKRGV